MTLAAGTLSPGTALTPEAQQRALDTFHREGVAVVPGALTPEECAALRAKVDEVFDAKGKGEGRGVYNGLVIGAMATHDRIFRDLVIHEPMLGLAVNERLKTSQSWALQNQPLD
ncbi:MAG: hypothetical protein NTW19_17425 [Planctomycetota bacterium]|nr:hypothetical protein [Planctomycetota bacterium]